MQQPVKVLYVLNAAGGGASLGIFEMLRALPRDRFLPYAVTPAGTESQMARLRPLFEDIRVVPMPWWNVHPELDLARKLALAVGKVRRGVTTAQSTQSIGQAISDWGIDIVHTGTSLTNSGALAARQFSIPHVWHIKESIGSKSRVRFPLGDRQLVEYMSGLSSHIIVMSEYIGEIFCLHGCKSVSVIPDGVDCDLYSSGKSQALRERLGVKPNETLVGMVAGLSSTWKRHDVYIRMVGRLAEQEPSTRFIAIGPKPAAKRWPHNRGTLYYEGLLELARKVVPPGRLEFLDFADDAPDIMRSLDILVHTCDEEPFGRVAIEAMAAGTPVVGPTTGGISETVVNGVTGLLAQPGDPEAFALATRSLLHDTEMRTKLGAAGRQRALSDYSLDRHNGLVTACYDDALKGAQR